MSASEVLSNLAAGGGLFMGGLSLWLSYHRMCERIVVIPMIIRALDSGEGYFCNEKDPLLFSSEERTRYILSGDIGVRIINKSEFDLDIDSVGFAADKTFSLGRSECCCPFVVSDIESSRLADDRTISMPIRMQSRQAITLRFNARERIHEIYQKGHFQLYVRTACRKVFIADALPLIMFFVQGIENSRI